MPQREGSTPVALASPAAFRAWLRANHRTATALLVRIAKAGAERTGITYPEALDEALCFGWIDGVRRKVDGDSFSIRFTPRKPRSIWSRVNVAHVERLMQGFQPKAGRYAIEYKSIYKVHQRVADDFRLGRVLLAGDAAHLNNPIGAFGLNGGIHDAINLAGKLGKVCRGEAGEDVLDLYVRQRRTVNLEYVQEHSIRNLRRLTARTAEERRRNFDELRRAASTVEGARNFLLVSSMIASVRRADAIT